MGLAPGEYAQSPELMELTFGDWEGLTWPEVEARDPAGARAREADKWNFVPPNGESYAQLAERLKRWLDSQSQDRFIASHGGVARALFYLLVNVDPRPPPASYLAGPGDLVYAPRRVSLGRLGRRQAAAASFRETRSRSACRSLANWWIPSASFSVAIGSSFIVQRKSFSSSLILAGAAPGVFGSSRRVNGP